MCKPAWNKSESINQKIANWRFQGMKIFIRAKFSVAEKVWCNSKLDNNSTIISKKYKLSTETSCCFIAEKLIWVSTTLKFSKCFGRTYFGGISQVSEKSSSEATVNKKNSASNIRLLLPRKHLATKIFGKTSEANEKIKNQSKKLEI